MIYLVFFCGLVFLSLPFIPTIIEVIRMTDAAPMKISSHILKDPRAAPELLFWHFTQLLNLDGLKSLEEKISITEPMEVNDSTLAIPAGKIPVLGKNIARVISAGSLELTEKTNYPSKILSFKSIVTGTQNALYEVHAMESLTLSSGNKVVWWASGSQVHIESNVNVPGKIQAKSEMNIKGKIQFHLLESPVIRAGVLASKEIEAPERSTQKITRTKKDFLIQEGQVFEGDLVVSGRLTIEKNATVLGSIKAYREITVHPGVRIFGNVVGMNHVDLQGSNIVTGSILIHGNLSIGGESQIGTPTHSITCSAKNIRLSGPFVAHGLLRAWKYGEYSGAV